jgi:hypothetical protein
MWGSPTPNLPEDTFDAPLAWGTLAGFGAVGAVLAGGAAVPAATVALARLAARYPQVAVLLQQIGASTVDDVATGGAGGAVPSLRGQYEAAVRALGQQADALRTAGLSAEQIARSLHAQRRALGVAFKDLTPPEVLDRIYARNLEKYGDRLGPTIEWLRAHGKSWEQIIESASRAGGRDLGF